MLFSVTVWGWEAGQSREATLFLWVSKAVRLVEYKRLGPPVMTGLSESVRLWLGSSRLLAWVSPKVKYHMAQVDTGCFWWTSSNRQEKQYEEKKRWPEGCARPKLNSERHSCTPGRLGSPAGREERLNSQLCPQLLWTQRSCLNLMQLSASFCRNKNSLIVFSSFNERMP